MQARDPWAKRHLPCDRVFAPALGPCPAQWKPTRPIVLDPFVHVWRPVRLLLASVVLTKGASLQDVHGGAMGWHDPAVRLLPLGLISIAAVEFLRCWRQSRVVALAFRRLRRGGALGLSFATLVACGQVEVVSDNGRSSLPVASDHCWQRCPARHNGRVVRRSHYTLQNDARTKFAAWVAYKVEPIYFGPSRDRNWQADPDLPPEETLEPEDYRGAHAALGTDRGHQAPLAAFAGGDWQSTNYLSNITPQKSALNQGPWRKLENAVRDLASHRGPLYVITGPLFDGPKGVPSRAWWALSKRLTLPHADEPHRVPSGYFKVVLRWSDGVLGGAAFVMPQTARRSDDPCSYRVPLKEAERRSGLLLVPMKRPMTDGSADLARDLGCS